MSTLLSNQHAQRVFCLLIALLCISGFMINNTLAAFWVAAYRQQQAIINDIQEQFPTIPSGSTLILDGACFEHGGAHVFTGGRDVAGAIIMAYQDPTLWATAIVDTPQVEEDGVSISTFQRNKFYAYNEKLFVYNIAQHKLYGLTDAATTQRYFRQSPFNPDRDCPPGFAWNWNASGSVVSEPNSN